jgi:hypothetical protein
MAALLGGAAISAFHDAGVTDELTPLRTITPTVGWTTLPSDLPQPLVASPHFQVDSDPSTGEVLFSTEVTNRSSRVIAAGAFELVAADSRVSLLSVSPSSISLPPGKAASLAFHFKVNSCAVDIESTPASSQLRYSLREWGGRGALELPGIRDANWHQITTDAICRLGDILGSG